MAADLTVPNLLPALPEIVLAIGAMLLLMVGVFAKQDVAKKVTNLSLLILAAVFVLVVSSTSERVLTFGGGFVMDGFAVYAKALVLIGSFVAVLVSPPYLKEKGINKFEFPALILLATLGMMMMISANDMLALYVGLELQSLSLYVLAAFNKDRARSSEAGLKYFVLGALSSGMLLYGISIVYGFSGTIGFDALAGLGHDAPIGFVVGMVFVLAGLAFKISAVPFHMWTPDVYE
ncbi:MAG: NADH-quinone oxidoreductase subunit N, partial [Sphingomonadales bacterium]|nr:NADH-quinone oxidoreductase subunit N [Sphingomonadales bacterium]